jgi:Uncharacterized conserved protein (DUF2249)/Hemerythrin HHE cation binding domain
MNEVHSSLSTQHAQIERALDAVIAAGRGACWPLYRRYLAGLREGLLQHLLFEEEALFPALEQHAAAAVKALREDHAQLRRHLETLGAAAPEQDPAGCIAELHELAALLRSHHAAEMALDPQYAVRPGPRLVLDEPAAMDLRGLRPPEPIVRIFQALERSPGVALRVILPHEPVPLYALLRECGYSCTGSPRPDGGFEVLIESS